MSDGPPSVTADWPELLRELAAIIGPAQTLLLASVVGGLDHVRIPCKPAEDSAHLWRRVLTAKEFAAVCKEYGGAHLSLPRGVHIRLSKRRIFELHAQGLNNRSIALEARCGERFVRRVLASASLTANIRHQSTPTTEETP